MLIFVLKILGTIAMVGGSGVIVWWATHRKRGVMDITNLDSRYGLKYKE